MSFLSNWVFNSAAGDRYTALQMTESLQQLPQEDGTSDDYLSRDMW